MTEQRSGEKQPEVRAAEPGGSERTGRPVEPPKQDVSEEVLKELRTQGF